MLGLGGDWEQAEEKALEDVTAAFQNMKRADRKGGRVALYMGRW